MCPCHCTYYAPSKMNQLKFCPPPLTIWKQYIKQFFKLRENWNFYWLSEIFIFPVCETYEFLEEEIVSNENARSQVSGLLQ